MIQKFLKIKYDSFILINEKQGSEKILYCFVSGHKLKKRFAWNLNIFKLGFKPKTISHSFAQGYERRRYAFWRTDKIGAAFSINFARKTRRGAPSPIYPVQNCFQQAQRSPAENFSHQQKRNRCYRRAAYDQVPSALKVPKIYLTKVSNACLTT